jgi:hypothetical protein
MKKKSLFVGDYQGQRSKVKKTSMVKPMFSLSSSRPIRFFQAGNPFNPVFSAGSSANQVSRG